ncbi:MAG TPA: dihydrolipoyllysine-residue acetyltransferase [Burkholderiales bacterium]|nr:dihydrolipoyllysine-residue acetyltransferase [Burkholderiales bacterium]
MMSVIELRIPDIGGHSDVNVAEVYVKVGDTINIDDNLLMLETDKATMEVPAEKAGVVTEVLVQVGSKINEGDVFVKVEAAGAVAAAPAAAVAAPVAEQPVVAATAPASAAAASSQVVPIIVPDLSGHDNVEIIEVSVKVGDTIAEEDSLITLETDKATMEVPATVGGVVKEIKVQLGGRVSQGDLILMVETTSAVAVAAPVAASAPAPTAAPVAAAPAPVASAPAAPAKVDETAFAKAFASPAIRKLARELGVDLGKVKGSGNKGRITEEDVKTFVKGVMSGQIATGAAPTNGSGVGLDLLPWPKVDFAKFGDVERKEMSRIKKISGGNMARNWVMIPHVTVFENADITDMEEFRKQLNEEYKRAEIKVTPLAFLIKAAVFALKKFPEFNASIDGDSIVYKNYYNIGFAADTPNGLTVPVIKDADKKGLVAIAQETSALAKAARDGKLKPTDMQGGTFTVSSLGGLGSTAFTPIINAPEVAILGVSKSSIAPVWNGKEFAPRLMLPLSLSFDHRIIDGALAAKFTTYLSQILSDLRRMAL